MSSIDLPVIEWPPALVVPRSLVVRYGYLRNMGEFPYDGDVRPGCGAKVVLQTRRGTEMAEVVTTTCSNGGCAKSVTRDKMMDYIKASGGSDYPFYTDGRILRIATPEDYREQSRIEGNKSQYVAAGKTLIAEMQLPMKLVEVELILGGEMSVFYFMSEHRVDFRVLVKHLATRFHTRIQMHQVGARDEARLVADYETCGQHCCCKQFLKVLKPVSMGAAKMQKATLDPNKISGRCGRLKCCLRYEEETYEDLRKKLPRLGTRVRTAEGVGVVIETMILTQLVKVRLENDRFAAVANEELLERDVPLPAERPAAPGADRPPIDRDRRPDARRDAGGPRREGDARPDVRPTARREPDTRREPDARREPRDADPRPPREPGPRRPPQDRPRPAPRSIDLPKPPAAVPAPIAEVTPPPDIPTIDAAPRDDEGRMSGEGDAAPLGTNVESGAVPPADNAPSPARPGIGAMGRGRRRRRRGSGIGGGGGSTDGGPANALGPDAPTEPPPAGPPPEPPAGT